MFLIKDIFCYLCEHFIHYSAFHSLLLSSKNIYKILFDHHNKEWWMDHFSIIFQKPGIQFKFLPGNKKRHGLCTQVHYEGFQTIKTKKTYVNGELEGNYTKTTSTCFGTTLIIEDGYFKNGHYVRKPTKHLAIKKTCHCNSLIFS